MRTCLYPLFLLLCLGFSLFFVSYAAASPEPKALHWDWTKSPNKLDWQRFMKAPLEQQQKLWLSLEKQGLHFEELGWEWRTAWVQVCGRSSQPVCAKILQLGLFDKALVVRAEAASRMGERFAGSGHAPALRLLATAYAVQQNKQGREPLYVQYRILHAIKQIGGDEGGHLGQRLAQGSPATARYWTRLALR
ncbi:MAG: hypothetical protein NTX25_10050 [Proteobacteria bacterium]|nr:hypothetical protein [Pseudomonadota bacterium]